MTKSTVANDGEFRITWRIFGEDLCPEKITEIIGLPPTRSHRKGDLVSLKSKYKSRRKMGMWGYCALIDGNKTFNEILQPFLETLQSKKQAIQTVQSKGYRTDLFIGLFGDHNTYSFCTTKQEVSQLANLNLEIGYDLYLFPDDDQISDDDNDEDEFPPRFCSLYLCVHANKQTTEDEQCIQKLASNDLKPSVDVNFAQEASTKAHYYKHDYAHNTNTFCENLESFLEALEGKHQVLQELREKRYVLSIAGAIDLNGWSMYGISLPCKQLKILNELQLGIDYHLTI